jgi:glycosyltransferase involved in cell wall biosynthesis
MEATAAHTRVVAVAGTRDRLRVGILGGVPAVLGGGGLEIQAARTATALRERGHDVRDVQRAEADWPPDVLHVFGHTADVGHFLHHWRRHPARLVVSPVVVVPPGREWRLKLGTRLPIPAFEPRVLRALVERADSLIALTRWESELLAGIGGTRSAPIAVIGNGVERPPELPDRAVLARELGAELPDRYAIVVGAVSERKRQAAIARALAGTLPLVVVGGWDGPERGRQRFVDLVRATGGVWLGELSDRTTVLGLVAAADALIHLSDAEGQSLAVLEGLALGTPCLLSDLPQQRELALRWPGAVTIVERDEQLAGALDRARMDDLGPVEPPIPSWDDVAAAVEAVYDSIAAPPRVWGGRG